jgi:hypothetical protein
VVSLRNLGPQESRAYLRACGVDEALHDRLIEVSRGHPLGLSLLADVAVRGGAATLDPAPDLVATLVRRFVDVVPVGLRRGALEASALARVTTEALLRETLEIDDAHDLFAWLRELSFMEVGPDGLRPTTSLAMCSTPTCAGATPPATSSSSAVSATVRDYAGAEEPDARALEGLSPPPLAGCGPHRRLAVGSRGLRQRT